MTKYDIKKLGDSMDIGLEVLQLIENDGYKAYIVGGFPRDLYLGNISDDIDICTNAPLYELENRFNVIETNFASSIIEYKNKNFEITHFRKDIEYKNHRFPVKIELVDDLKTDLLRRDFTINTLCINKDGNYIDLLDATIDLNNKIIKTVGDANHKLTEDALRILRAIRFATILNFDISDDLDKAIIDNAHLVTKLSSKRQKEEIEKIITSLYKERGIILLKKYGIDTILNIDLNISFDKILEQL